MTFKRCNTCGKTIVGDNVKCPYCGGESFSPVDQQALKADGRKDAYLRTKAGGSFWGGFVLGLAFCLFGTLIACISPDGSERGETIRGSIYGAVVSGVLAFVIALIVILA